MVTATLAQLVDAAYSTDSTARDAAIVAAKTIVTAALEETALVEDTDSERRKLYIAEAAVNMLIAKSNSRSGEGLTTLEMNQFLPQELKELIASSTDEDDSRSSTIYIDNEGFDRRTNHWRKTKI